MKGIYKFYWDCGRAGSLNGSFIATAKEVENIQGKYIDFGEVLGKHSEVCGTIDEGEIKLVTDEQDFVNRCEEVFGVTISGYNPFDYYEEEEDEDE